ncbi:FAD-dependent oxidoreductase [Gordonia sp. zg691]|uniref:NAD(P)/FAD-dependent oxidoreductase n=1 Tax=Gordonia jinghuaiqii TaxID=2758710 RepID=UPI0016627654|nr:FAD-dependent oxidoreductase [Gordonia jinghuaiqii]MBD0860328.1 FAD-dependent oxidoreductase [Gordonia jinghuaiqii]
MNNADDPVVIVGAGHGGAALAALLRQSGYTGGLVLIGAEHHLPYHRPPLSKKFGGPELYQQLRPEEFYADNDIDLKCAVTVTGIDRPAGRVHLSDGTTCAYRALVLATGSAPRSLPVPGADSPGVLTLRTLDDARGLEAALTRRDRLAIIGGGYVGMEVAAVARSVDIPVTILELEERVLARVASAALSQRLSSYHRERGTSIVTGAQVCAIVHEKSRSSGVELADGTVIEADTVLVGIGAVPNDTLAHRSGIACDGGVLVDDESRTSDPSVFAIGDVARRPVRGADGLVRLESIPNVTEQARQIAAALLDLDRPEPEVPWFWSDQFDLKLKIAGLVSRGSRVLHRPGRKPGSFALFHLSTDDTVTAVETVNAAGEFVAGKNFIAERCPVDADLLVRPDVSLRDVRVPATSFT